MSEVNLSHVEKPMILPGKIDYRNQYYKHISYIMVYEY